MKYRIKFSKYDTMVFIGHLDVMRYFQKAFRRAELPIAYSTGFSPHQILSFAAPLGVGHFSNGEYLDCEFTEMVAEQEIVDRLNAVMVTGIDILGATQLDEHATNAMASVAAAKYTVRVRAGHEMPFDIFEHFDAFMKQDEILYEKQTKKSTKMLNLKEFIFDYCVGDDSIELLVDASSSGNIKPSLVMDAFFVANQQAIGEFDFVYTREETYRRNEEGELVPLNA